MAAVRKHQKGLEIEYWHCAVYIDIYIVMYACTYRVSPLLSNFARIYAIVFQAAKLDTSERRNTYRTVCYLNKSGLKDITLLSLLLIF